MSVQTTATQIVYTENGSTLQYGWSASQFTIFEAIDIVVTSVNTSTGATTTLVMGTDYTVTVNADGSGYITKTVALSSTYNLVIQRVLPLSQLIVFTDNVSTDAATYEEGYDRLVMIAQQLQAQINNCAVLPVGSSGPITLPTPVEGELLGWHNGQLTNFTVSGSSPSGPSFPTTNVILGDGVSNNSVRFQLSGSTVNLQILLNGSWTTVFTFS
jgi:hypothetical protein